MAIGIQPTCWTNDDFPEIGNETPYQVILEQTREAGYEGGSTGHNYPTHLPSLLRSLENPNMSAETPATSSDNIKPLRIASTWFGTSFTTGVNFDVAVTAFKQQIEFLKAVKAKDVVVAELANAVNQVRSKSVLDDRPILNTPEWYLLATSLNIAGEIAQKEGMQLSYHPHVGTGVMTIDEADRLLASTKEKYVGLCLDTAHLLYGGATRATKATKDDVVEFAKRHKHRIKHVHLKNVRKSVLPVARENNYSFYQAIQEGIFTVPGDTEGELDLDRILEVLQSVSYNGWLVVEAEQNPLHADPLQCAHTAREYIRSKLHY
jgi:inosose dehydratase